MGRAAPRQGFVFSMVCSSFRGGPGMSAFSDSVYEKKVGEITGKSTFKIRVDMLYCSVTTGHYIYKPWKIERQEGNQDEAYSDTEHTDSAEYREKRWLRRVPDILPVSM